MASRVDCCLGTFGFEVDGAEADGRLAHRRVAGSESEGEEGQKDHKSGHGWHSMRRRAGTSGRSIVW